MVFDTAIQRLTTAALLPELQEALQHMLEHDARRSAGSAHWRTVIPTVQHLLDGDANTIAPFMAAWYVMYAAISRLDQLQDGDPIDDPLVAASAPGCQYNLVFAYYLLATHLLNDLSSIGVPSRRIMRLRTFWDDSMLRMASGQQRDLMLQNTPPLSAPLSLYQGIAQYKTGASFALAFGGTALLCTDETPIIESLTLTGEIYGTLLQYSDDLRDADQQPNRTLTFPEAVASALPDSAGENETTQRAFASYVYKTYFDHAAQALAAVPTPIHDGVLALFQSTFGVLSN